VSLLFLREMAFPFQAPGGMPKKKGEQPRPCLPALLSPGFQAQAACPLRFTALYVLAESRACEAEPREPHSFSLLLVFFDDSAWVI